LFLPFYPSTYLSIHPLFDLHKIRMVDVDDFFHHDGTGPQGDESTASPQGDGREPPTPALSHVAAATATRFTEQPQQEEPSAKRTKKEWLAFVCTKHTRVGEDFQVLSLPVPDRGSIPGDAAANGMGNHNRSPSGNGHGRSETVSDDDQGTIATATAITTTPLTYGGDGSEGNEIDSM
jgi:hypothetical protein